MEVKSADNQLSTGADKEGIRQLAETPYQTLFEQAPLGILIANTESYYLDANPTMCRMLGYTRDELIGLQASDIVVPAEIGHISPALQAIKQHRDYHREWQFRRKDGTVFSAEVTATTMPDGNLLGMVRDISERRLAEQEISLKNTILLTQQETSLDAILVVGENEQILSLNQRFIELWGISPAVSTGLDEPLLQSVAEQIEDTEAFIARVRYLYAHRNEKSSDEIHLRDGRIIDGYSSPIKGHDGRYFGRIWYFRDVTESKRAQEALQRSEGEQRELVQLLKAERSRLVAAQQVAKVGSWETDLTTMAVIWSEETYRIFETDAAHFHPTHPDFLAKVHPEDRAAVDQAFIQSLQQHSACEIEHRLLLPSGRIKFVEEHWQILFDEQGKPARVIGTCQDIIARKEAEARIVYLNRVYAMLSSINTLIVRVCDRTELFREACRIATETGGFRMAMITIVDRNTGQIIPVASQGKDEELMAAINGILSSGEGRKKSMVARAIKEKKAVIANDSLSDSRVLIGKKYAASGVRSIAVLPLIISGVVEGTFALYAREAEFFHEEEMQLLTDLTRDIAFAIDYINKQERLNYLAYYDVLTGLANRSLFQERVAQFIRSADSNGHKLALCLIDLERFKNINDSLGRSLGDALLKQVAEWLTQNLGGATLLARLGADHFAAVVPEVREGSELSRLFDKTSQAFLAHPFHLNGGVFRIAAKAGVAIFPDDGADFDNLFKNAEAALKKTKKSGDRYLFHAPKMTAEVAAKLTLENQLRQAIDNEEFVLYYQPKVNLVSGKVTGAEALIRWNDPRTGLVAPGLFIPLLEETGLIYEVGRWALGKALEDYLRWRAMGLASVRIAVNVSPLQLRNPGFVAEIEQKIGLDAHAAEGLELEITESVVMEDINHSIVTLHAIRVSGVAIAIDDFGTGFSSLSYLSKLPVDTLKIDRSFIIEMAAPEGLALVSTIIIVAHALKLKVVAEGVETEEQLRLLRSLNCDEMQGYLFSKPVPVDIFETRFLN
jgi:diguanylate cyclase (GGDEF)-like protein/PAS domain S-box-containing protein